MFFDARIDVPPQDRAHVIRTCATLGYDVVAFNRTVRTKKLSAEHEAERGASALPLELESDAGAALLRIDSQKLRGTGRVRVLQRITLDITDNSQVREN